jgi:shikimate dehydrogenase
MIFAEVIGDPIAQSKSPAIHKEWLARLGIDANYVRTRVAAEELTLFLDQRRADLDWRGCNVTIPHKQAIIALLDRLDPAAAAIGAVNCVVREGRALIGYNTDIDGVAAALDGADLAGGKAVLIGAGGGARAVVAYLERRGTVEIAVVARNMERAGALRAAAPSKHIEVHSFAGADQALAGAAAIINASPLGMAGASAMPPALLDSIRRHASGATIFDLVTTPAATDFLRAGLAGGGRPVDGLVMLVGQAAGAFEHFFGAPAPAPDDALRRLLTAVPE